MRALLEDMKTGQVQVHEIPRPELRRGGVLVRTHYSAVSAGTERVKVETGEKSLIQKAMARPDLVKQVVDFARQNGVQAAIQKVQARLDTLATLGYSCAGEVIEVGEGVTDLSPGDRVACGGAGASHCEVTFVARNLVVRVPHEVGLDAASLTTIAAIAMQGLRQANVAFGGTVVIVGAGLLGVLAIRLARAAGCRVIAIDRDARRVERARELGAHLALETNDPGLVAAVQTFSRYGADAALITAATDSAEPVELAAELLRDRGVAVIVGDVGMGVSRDPMYMKELSLVMSRSYGPGRYDPAYEEEGRDYPIGYVRWTEQRNMEAVLDLMATGALDVTPLLTPKFPVEEGHKAYEAIRQNGAYTALISYGEARVATSTPARPSLPRRHREVGIGMIGAGGFARSVLLPELRRIDNVRLVSVATSNGVGAESARRVFSFADAQGAADLLANPGVDLAFVVSRHDSHARYAIQALQQHKAVFVEKPLAVTSEQLDSVVDAYEHERSAGRAPFVMVGFNRRFAPATTQLNEHFAPAREPFAIQARINAGFIPSDHWVHLDGGRIVGELCHFVDWCRAVVGSPIKSVFGSALPDASRYHQDNVVVVLRFADGSVANVSYFANGDRSVPKEHLEVFCGGRTARIDNFERLHLSSNGKSRVVKLGRDKGHKREMELTTQAVTRGSPSPIPFGELVEVTRAVFALQESLRRNEVVAVEALASAGAESANLPVELGSG
jgi:polar amino acid transport system substrate-binding protein